MDRFKKRNLPPSAPRRLVPRSPTPRANRPTDDSGQAGEWGEQIPTGASASPPPTGPAASIESAEPGEPGRGGRRGLLLFVPIVVIIGAVVVGVSLASIGPPEPAGPVIAAGPTSSPEPTFTPTFTPTFSPVDPTTKAPDVPQVIPPLIPPSIGEETPSPSPKPRRTARSRPDQLAPRRTSTPTAKPAPRPATFSAISGEDCLRSARASYSVVGVDDQWFKGLGGYDREGCMGTFRAIPKSGDASRDDQQEFAVWSFKPTFATGSCKTSVFIPDNRSADGTPASYKIIKSATNQTATASFQVDQKSNRGRFVTVGTFKFRNGSFAVKLGNRGSITTGTHVAAAQIKVTCTAA
jgi:hypothetical protein